MRDERSPVNVEVMLERESLAESIETILGGDADALAGLLVEFRDALDAGLKGIARAREALGVGIELAYLRTRAHEAARRLYVLSQEGQLRVEDEPVRLIGAAIERSTAQGGRGSRRAGRATR
ncbi:MAG TPA: hypothetical protein VEQ42_02805 [Pyrinomonadaceae bacterium]|nr:hypothetical protein [Pyrinomonadaceae bacterium]